MMPSAGKVQRGVLHWELFAVVFFDVVVVVVLGYFPSRAKGKALHSRSQSLSYSDSYGDTDRQWQWLWRIACLSFGLFDCAKSSSPFNVFVCWNNSGCLLLISFCFCFCLSFYCWLLLLMLLWYVVPHFHLCGQLFTVPFFHLFFCQTSTWAFSFFNFLSFFCCGTIVALVFSYFLLLFLSHFFHFPLLNIFSHEVFLPEHEKFTTCRISRSKRNRNRKTNENSRKCSFRSTNVCIRNVSKASGMRTPTEELKQHRDSQLSSCSTNNHTPTHTFIHSLSLLVILP